MAKTKKHRMESDVLLDWQFPNEEAWAQTQSPMTPTPTLGWRRRHGLIEKSIVLVLITSIGVVCWLWQQAKRTDQRSKIALLKLILQETGPSNNEAIQSPGTPIQQVGGEQGRRAQQGQVPLLAAVSSTEPATTTISVEELTWQGEFAVAQVLVTLPEAGVGYRQTRVYRSTPAGWRPTAPDLPIWGPVHSLQTSNFTFLFRELDQQAVATVALMVDELHAALRQDFGLPSADPNERIVIELAPTVTFGKLLDSSAPNQRIVVPSPALLPIATELTTADVLMQHIVAALSAQIATTATSSVKDPWTWYNLITAVRRWQLWQSNIALATWHNELTAWLYSTALVNPNDATSTAAEAEAMLCRKAKIMEAAAPAGAPILTPWCAKPEHLQQLLASGRPASRLAELVAPTANWATQGSAWPDWYHYSALETLVNYAVNTYGRERLPVLLAALDHHHRWETLIPAVFQVSAAEFEQGWQAYLRSRYHLPNDQFTTADAPVLNNR